MATPTPEGARARNIEKMGQELGEQYSALWQEMAYLEMKWADYVELFGTKPSRVDMLNQAAPSFFGIIDREMWKDILMHLARLTDPPKSSGRSNLTVQNIPHLVENPELKARLKELVAVAVSRTAFCRDWRNRIIAHRDLETVMDRPSKPLENGSRHDVSQALDAITAILNAVSARYLESESSFRIGTHSGGAISLLYVLNDGLEEKARRRERLEKGEYLESDFRRKDI